MTLDEEINTWRKRAEEARLDGTAGLFFGVAAGLTIARDQYGAQQEARPIVDGPSESSNREEESSGDYGYR
jgi:hypothetical protein